jgi:plasmid replication initiation protein
MKNPHPLKSLTSKTLKVYKNKKLNTANFGDFNHTDYQVFLHLISKLGGVDESGRYLQPEELQREHILSAKEFSQVFNTDISNSYGFLHKSCKKLMKTSICLEKLELFELWEINVCSTAKYNVKEGTIRIKFTDDIMPYLAQVREKFILYNIKEIANFGSLYTTRLYELIQEFKETGWMLKSIDQLRELFFVGEKFNSYYNFKKRTFCHACQEINKYYKLDLRFEEIKEGRKIVAVKFLFKKTTITQFTNQKTKKIINVYEKPEARHKEKDERVRKKKNVNEVLDGQLSFADIKSEAKPIKGLLSSIFSKLNPFKKSKY